jgi:hypothetical protein
LWGFPKPRSVDPSAKVANSVAIRCQHDQTYRPGNLEIANGVLGGKYAITDVVAPPPA